MEGSFGNKNISPETKMRNSAFFDPVPDRTLSAPGHPSSLRHAISCANIIINSCFH